MAILENRGIIRSKVRGYSLIAIYLFRKCFAILLLIIALYFAKFSYPLFIQNFIDNISGRIIDSTHFIYKNVVQVGIFTYEHITLFKDFKKENIKLKNENAQLQDMVYQLNLLNIENQELRKMFSLPEHSDRLGKKQVVQVIGASINPYSKRVIIKAGINDGVEVDDIITGTKGLLGRIIEVGENYSKGILLGDSEFRISVISEEGGTYGILVKQDNALKIIYLEDEHHLRPGQFIYSSGDGKIFPAGILIGVISKIHDNEVYVKPVEELNGLGFVMISPSLQKIIKKPL
ncbi:MAG: rod shape-determining protein MreC [Rickettsiaceae bacterium]|nr:rod shape-determining protein MreC [Rickettsiaceae bacterium]